MSVSGLQDAASVLDAQADGRTPDRDQLIAGVFALDTLCRDGNVDRDLLDAAAGLRMLAESGELELDESGRDRAARLADAVRKVASR